MHKFLLSFLILAFALSLVSVGAVSAAETDDSANPPAIGQQIKGWLKQWRGLENRPELIDEEIAAHKQARLEQDAETLGITVDELKAKLDSGMTMIEIAKEQGVDPEELRPAGPKAPQKRPQLSDEEIAVREQARLEDVAQILGISADEIKVKLDSGMKIVEIAKELGISQDDFRAKMQEQSKVRMTERLNELVGQGKITQEQADKRLEQMQKRLENGKRPGNWPGGFLMGAKPDTATE